MKKNIILFIISFAMFMEAVDTTILNTAIPSMAHSLGINPLDLKIALISYLLSLAIFIPISGWVADKFGPKKVFIGAIVLFTISSFWCGMTQTLPELIIARILQGLGGSLTIPVGRLIIVRTCNRNELISKMSIVVMVSALGMVLGPVLGGLITEHFSWPWIFWVNIPFGLLTVLLAWYLLPDMPAKVVPPLDKWGFIYFGAGLSTLTFGLTILSESVGESVKALLYIGLSFLFLMAYVIHSRKQKYPIVNIELWHLRTFKVSAVGNLLGRIGFGGIPFLLPLLFQIGLGYSPQTSGFLLAPMAVGLLCIKPFSLRLLQFFGYKKLLILNTIFVGLSLASFMSVNSNTSIYTIGFLTYIFGFLIALQYSGMNSLAYSEIPIESLSSATSIMSTLQQLAQSFGVAIAALCLRFFADTGQHFHFPIEDFHYTFLAMSIITLLSCFIFMQLREGDGKEMIGTITTTPSA